MATHTEKDFEKMMNDEYELATIAGHSYGAGYALRLVDPILFRQAYLDWLDEAGVAGDFPEIDFDTLPEETEDCELMLYDSIKEFTLMDHRNLWDDTVVVTEDGFAIHIVDSSNMDEYTFRNEDELWDSPYGTKLCAGCVDFYAYIYKPVSHIWEEIDNGVYEYYPEDTLQTFLERNQVI